MEPEIATAFIDREPVPVPRDLYNFAKQSLWCWPLVLMATFGLGVVTAQGWKPPVIDMRLYREPVPYVKGQTGDVYSVAPVCSKVPVRVREYRGAASSGGDHYVPECHTGGTVTR